MKKRLARKGLMAVSLLVASISATPALASWQVNQPESYFKPQQYNNGNYGNFPPADIDEKLFGHLNTGGAQKENQSQTDNAAVASSNNQPAPPKIPQTSNPAQGYPVQNSQPPAYGNYNQGRYYAPPGNQRYNRNTNFNGPWNNNRSSLSGPWNNNGSSFGGPWNNNGSNFSGPWNNNGSNFSMPWGNNNGSGSGFNPMGNGGGLSW